MAMSGEMTQMVNIRFRGAFCQMCRWPLFTIPKPMMAAVFICTSEVGMPRHNDDTSKMDAVMIEM